MKHYNAVLKGTSVPNLPEAYFADLEVFTAQKWFRIVFLILPLTLRHPIC
jgi:hypothetical protein